MRLAIMDIQHFHFKVLSVPISISLTSQRGVRTSHFIHTTYIKNLQDLDIWPGVSDLFM